MSGYSTSYIAALHETNDWLVSNVINFTESFCNPWMLSEIQMFTLTP